MLAGSTDSVDFSGVFSGLSSSSKDGQLPPASVVLLSRSFNALRAKFLKYKNSFSILIYLSVIVILLINKCKSCLKLNQFQELTSTEQ